MPEPRPQPLSRRSLLALGGAGLLGLTAACGSGGSDGGDGNGVVSGITTSDDDGYHGALLTKPYPLTDVTLTDTADRPFDTVSGTKGKLSVLFFGYTQCPDICQAVMATLASAYVRLPAADQRRTQVLFVTTDPARDTVPVLRTYLDRLDPSFIGLTGSLSTIDRLGKPLGIFIKKGQKLPSGGYEVDHTTTVVAVGGAGTAPLVWSADSSPADVAADIEKLLRSGVAA